MKRILWIVLAFLAFFSSKASHFAGGDCYYDYISATPGDNTKARYAVHYIFFRDIQGTQFTATSISIGMYDASISPHSQANETLRTVPQYSRYFLNQYSPGCYYKSPIGYERIEFIDTIDLLKTKGYFFSTTNTARNSGQIVNLNSFGPFSIVLSTYIPPKNSFTNSSPRFRALPVPYACVGKKYVFNHDGYDPDGDSLVFSFQWPYGQGGTYRNNGNVGDAGIPDLNVPGLPAAQRPYFPTRPPLPGNNLNISGYYNPVSFNGAYSFPSNQVGAVSSDTLKINSQTGEISFTPASQGGFVIAIECAEYRVDRLNNTVTYLGSTRRDLQFYFDAGCSFNTAPEIYTTDTFTLYVGDSLKLDAYAIDFDPTNDKVFMDVSGDIIGTGINQAKYTVTSAIGQATLNLRWKPTCSYARTAPYFVIISAKDSICATTQKTVYIRVLPKDIIPPPTAKCVTINSPSSIGINWKRTTSASADFGKYYIYRNENGGPYALIDSVSNRNTQSYTDTKVQLATSLNVYGYYLISVNSCGEPGLSSDTIFSLLPKYTQISSTQFLVQWPSISNKLGTTFSQTDSVFEDRGFGFNFVGNYIPNSYITSACNLSSKTKIINVDPSKFCISIGISENYTLKDTIRPSPPLINLFSVNAAGKATILVQKSDSLDAVKYLIYRSSNGGSYSLIDSVNQSGVGTFIYEDLSSKPATIKYCYKVAARDSCGNLSFQSPENCGIKLVGVSGHFCNYLSWTPFANPTLTKYVLQKLVGSNWVNVTTTSTTTTSYTDTPLACGKSITYRVFGAFGVLDSSFSNTLTLTPRDTIRPLSPVILLVSAISNDTVQITYLKSKDPRVKSNQLQFSTNGGTFGTAPISVVSTKGDTVTVIHKLLDNSLNKYCYRIIAFDSCSNTQSIPVDTHCVVQLTITPGSRTNLVQWTPYPFPSVDSVVVDRLVGSVWQNWKIIKGNATSFLDTGIVCNTTITYRVQVNYQNFISISNIKSGTPFDTTPPSNPVISLVDYASMNMTIYQKFGYDVAGWNIYYSTNNGPYSLLINNFKSFNKSFNVVSLPGLNPVINQYSFYVTSFDSCSGLESTPSPIYIPPHIRGVGGPYTAQMTFNYPVTGAKTGLGWDSLVLERNLSPTIGFLPVKYIKTVGPTTITDTVPEYFLDTLFYKDTIDIYCGQGIPYRFAYYSTAVNRALGYSNEYIVYPTDTFSPNNVNTFYISTTAPDSFEISWKKHIRPTVSKYVVQISKNGGTFQSIDTVLNNQPFVFKQTYGGYNMSNTIIKGRIIALDTCSNKWSQTYETHTHTYLWGKSLYGQSKAVLNWHPYVGFANGFKYKIERKLPNSNIYLTIGNVTDTFFVDSFMPCNMPLNYRIRIDEVIADGGAGYTNVITLTGSDTIPPTMPEIIITSVFNSNTVSIIPNTISKDVDSLEIYSRSLNSGYQKIGTYAADSIVFVKNNFLSDSVYYYKFISIDSCANNRSVVSNEHSTILLQGVEGNQANYLNWNKYFGYPESRIRYLVQSFELGNWITLDTLPGSKNYFAHNNLWCGFVKTYRIETMLDTGFYFGFSNVISLTPKDSTPPAYPEIIAATVVDQNSTFIQWAPSTSLDVNQYEIWRKDQNASTFSLVKTVGNTDTATVHGNTVDSIYTYYILAVDSCGKNRSAVGPKHTVANIQGISQNLQIILNWSNYSGIPGQNSLILEEFDGTNWNSKDTLLGNSGSITYDSLPCAQGFQYRLSYIDARGKILSYSDSIYITSFDTVVPVNPTITYLSTTGFDSITVSWLPSVEPNISKYYIYAAPLGNTPILVDSVVSTKTLSSTFFVSNPNSPWTVYVLAYNSCSNKISYFKDSVVTYHPITQRDGCGLINILRWPSAKFHFLTGNGNIFIYRGFDTVSMISLGSVVPGVDSFVDATVQLHERYYYKLIVHDSLNSQSSLSFTITDSLVSPEIINPILVSVTNTDQNNGTILVRIPDQSANTYLGKVNVYGSAFPWGSKTNLGSIIYPDSEFYYSGISTVDSSYYIYIVQEDFCGNQSDTSLVSRSIDFSVVATQQKNNIMNWNFYEGDSVKYYRIETFDGTQWNSFDSVPSNIQAYVRFPAPCNEIITYRLAAELKNGLTSYSDSVVVNTLDIIPADAVSVQNATVLNDSVIQLNFTMADSSDIYGYYVQRATNGGVGSTIKFISQISGGTPVVYFDTISTLVDQHCYTVITIDSCLNVTPSVQFCPIQLKGQGQNLQNKLVWTSFQGYSVQNYEVYELQGSIWNQLASNVASDTEYIHQPLNCGQTRFYKIKSIGVNGTISESDTIHLTPFDTIPPVAPVLTRASVLGNGMVELNWTAVGGDIKAYEIWTKTAGQKNFNFVAAVGTTTYYQVSGLNTQDSVNQFEIFALDSCAFNRSFPSIPHATMQLGGQAQNTQNLLTWTSYSGLSAKKVWIQTYQKGWKTIDSVIGSKNNYVDDTLACNVPVIYRVIAQLTNDSLSVSDSIRLTPFDTIPPAQPEIQRASVLSNSSVQLTWKWGPKDIGQYEIWMKSISASSFSKLATVGYTNSYTVTGLNTTDSIYCFQIIALDTCASNRSIASLNECTIQLTGVAENTQNTIQWTDYSTYTGAPKYYIQTLSNVGFWSTIDSNFSALRTYIHINLPCNIPVNYRIMGVFSGVDTVYSDTIILTPFDTIKPIASVLTSVSILEDGNIVIKWNKNANVDVKYHDIYRAPIGSSVFTSVGTATDVDSFLDVTATNTSSQRYTYYVIAIDSCNPLNRAPQSNQHTSSNLNVSSGSCQPAVKLTWNSYPWFGNGLQGYAVMRSDGGAWTQVTTVSATDTSYTDYSVNAKNGYCYQIMAISTAGLYAATTDTSCQVPRLYPNPDPVSMYSVSTVQTGTTTGSVKIVWNRFAPTAVLSRGYVLYHSTTGVWPFTPIKVINLADDTVYWHTNINTSDSTHYYSVRVIDTCGAQSDSSAPFRTIDLKLTIGNGAMVLDWLPSLNITESGYEIEKSFNGGPFGSYTILPAGTIQFVDSAVSCGFRYSYRVKALYSLRPNATNISDSVSGISIDTIPPDIALVQMATVAVPAKVGGRIDISFFSPPQINRSGYNIYRKVNNGPWMILSNQTTTQYGLIGVSDFSLNTLDSLYSYKITSLDSCGNESKAGEIHRPVNISVTAVSQANLVQWTPYLGFDSLVYRIERSVNGGLFNPLYDIIDGSTHFTDSSTKCDTFYNYRIKVYDIQNPLVQSYSDTSQVMGMDKTAPNAPQIGVVSVTSTDPYSGGIQINWVNSTSTDVRYHVIERRSSGSANWVVRARIPAMGPTTFNDFGNTTDSIYYYRMYAIDTCGNISTIANEHAFVHVDAIPQNESILLNWTPYVGFPVGKYDVIRDGVVVASFLGGSTLSYLDTNLLCINKYKYTIKTYGLDQLTYSLSNEDIASPFDTTAPKVAYVQVASVMPGDASVKITFRASESFDVRTYQIWRRENGTGKPLVVYQSNGPIVAFTTIYDTLNVHVDVQTYCYTVVAFDYCGNKSIESNTGCTMLAKAQYNQLQTTIQWTPYTQWKAGVDHYEIERTTDGINWVQVGNAANTITQFKDQDLPADARKLCYRVLAIEPSGNFNETSISNTICVVPEPIVHIPTAFSPGYSSGLNDEFGPVAAFYDQFTLTIYDRWGNKIFDGKDRTQLWDGKLKGELVPPGAYVYQIILTDFAGKEYRYQGMVSIVR